MERPYNEDRLSAYFDGELPLNERSEMEAMLRASPEMRRTLDEFRRQREWMVTLRSPALPEDFTARVMQQVLASAQTRVAFEPAPPTPPPFPVRTRSNPSKWVAAITLSAAATVALGVFIANQFGNSENRGNHLVQADPPKSPHETDKDSVVDPATQPDDNRVAPNDSSKIASNDPANTAATQPDASDLEPIPPATKGATENSIAKNSIANESPAVASSDKSKENINAAMPSARSSASGVTVANTPKGNPRATMKSRPKAYRVQIATHSEFEARLKDAGVPFYHTKKIDPPSDASKPIRVDILPDPVYVLVEGPESRLDELVSKLQAQADLALSELIDDLEAQMLLTAVASSDAVGNELRPAESKDDELAGYLFPAKALRSSVPLVTPTPSSLPTSSQRVTNPQIPVKPAELPRDMLHVPRVLFILDVRMGEIEGKSKN